VSNGLYTCAKTLAQVKNAVFEVVRILCVGLANRGFQLWDLAVVVLLFGELLNPSSIDLELLSDQSGIHIVINNTLTDPGDIILVKLHFTGWLVGQIMPTKSLAYTTRLRRTPYFYLIRCYWLILMNQTLISGLISEVRAVCRHVTHAPRRSDLLKHTDHFEQIFKRRFGSLKSALEVADILTYNLGKWSRSRLSSTTSSASQPTSTGRHIVPTLKPTANTTSRHTSSGAGAPETTS